MYILEVRGIVSTDDVGKTPSRMTYSFNTKDELIAFLSINDEKEKKESQESIEELHNKITVLRHENNILRLQLLKNHIKFYDNIHQLLISLHSYLAMMIENKKIASEIMDMILNSSQSLFWDL